MYCNRMRWSGHKKKKKKKKTDFHEIVGGRNEYRNYDGTKIFNVE